MIKTNSYLIENYIQENKLTKKQFAEKCGFSIHILNNFLSGQAKNLKGKDMYKLSKATNIRVDDFLNIKNNK